MNSSRKAVTSPDRLPRKMPRPLGSQGSTSATITSPTEASTAHYSDGSLAGNDCLTRSSITASRTAWRRRERMAVASACQTSDGERSRRRNHVSTASLAGQQEQHARTIKPNG